MSKILVIRLSAIGDVAMTIPVVYAVAEANPGDSFTVLTQTFLMPLFMNRPLNVNMMGVNTKNTEKSFLGFLRYTFILRKYKFDKVLDLHCVIRSRIVDFIFRLSGKPVFKIDKGRKERKFLTRRPPKEIYPLRPVTARYADVFHSAGFDFGETFVSLYDKNPVDEMAIKVMAGDKKGRWVGIAPFAGHKGKIYPPEKMEKVVKALSEQTDMKIFLFGGPNEEKNVIDSWKEKYQNTVSMAGRYLLDMELALISRLDILVSMDSANMHFASLAGTKVISVWGATHPYAGFYGYHQREDLIVQVDLPCRPCSIYGNKPCYRGDWACLNEIRPAQIVNKVMDYLNEL
ncbi:MAG: glycosyltransferase family 9 protein [Tannerella sp.]|jgi:ADP-heptose:LPS heptosyltransferase|nr:glycosyltransferase family 9 protein [Tannerella sp.]